MTIAPCTAYRPGVASDRRAGLYPPLLKHWRGQRGWSQLDLALTADVSSRHVSFLETGRSSPSAEMVLRLAHALGVPLRHINTMLRAAGHEAIYAEPSPGEALPPEVQNALHLMKEHHEPFPLVVFDRAYTIVDSNRAAMALLSALAPDLPDVSRLNLLRMTLDRASFGGALVNFDEVGRFMLFRLQREVRAAPDDDVLRALLDDVLAMPSVPADWRAPDYTEPASPALVVHLRLGSRELRFLTLITAFQAPQAVHLEEMRIETWFPADPSTAAVCREMAG